MTPAGDGYDPAWCMAWRRPTCSMGEDRFLEAAKALRSREHMRFYDGDEDLIYWWSMVSK